MTQVTSFQYNNDLVSEEERETHISISYFNETFCVYTTNKKTANMLRSRFPEYFTLTKDCVSATVTEVPLEQITKLWLSKLKP